MDDVVLTEETSEEEISQVEARTGYQAITSYNEAGELITLGRVRKRAYEGNQNIRAFALETIEGKEHRLGTGSKDFKVFSHSDIIGPLLAHGFKPASIMHARGGASVMAFLEQPEKEYPDPIGWDTFADDSPTRPPLTLSVRVRSDLRRGHGVNLTLGYFRLICLNGLIAKTLDLGDLSIDHRNFSMEKVQDWLDTHIVPDPSALPKASSNLIDEVRRYVGMTDPEEISRLPRLLRTPVTKMANELGQAVRKELLANLERIEQMVPTFTVLDLANAYTNTANSVRSRWGVYDEADPVVKGLRDIVELVGLKQDERTFEAA